MAAPKSYDYLQADFVADVLSLGRGVPAPALQTDILQAIEARFLARYPDSMEAQWKMLRCCAAHSYFVRNMEAFNKGALAVTGKESALIGGRIVRMLWICWAVKDDSDPLTYDPPIGAFVQACESL